MTKNKLRKFSKQDSSRLERFLENLRTELCLGPSQRIFDCSILYERFEKFPTRELYEQVYKKGKTTKAGQLCRKFARDYHRSEINIGSLVGIWCPRCGSDGRGAYLEFSPREITKPTIRIGDAVKYENFRCPHGID